jgi:hypothetical protein
MSLEVAFRLPLQGAPRAVFASDFGLRGGRLTVDGNLVLAVDSRAALERGMVVPLGHARLTLRTLDDEVRLWVDGVEAPREDRLRAPTSRSAWVHACMALAASAFGFIASWLYIGRGDAWSTKMALHMAAWHLLLTLTLFPASVWGQRVGIRAVQLAALVFFCIHLGIAIANIAAPMDGIAILNAASGMAFLATTVYGQRAHRDMDPLRELDRNRERLLRRR